MSRQRLFICDGSARGRAQADHRSAPRAARRSATYKRPSAEAPLVSVLATGPLRYEGRCSRLGVPFDMAGEGSVVEGPYTGRS